MRITPILVLLVITIAAASSQGATEPTTAATASAQLTFSRYVAPDCDNLFVLGDPMPSLRQLFNSATFHRFATASKIAQVMSQNGVDLSQTLTKVEANSPYIPAEVAIGFPSTAYDEFARIAKLALATGLCVGANSVGGDTVQTDMPRLETIVLETTRALKTPRMSAWVRFRDPQLASTLFAIVASKVPQQLARANVKASIEGDTMHMKCSLADVVPAYIISGVLVKKGMVTGPDDPQLVQISDAFAKLEAELWLERINDGLRLTLGRRPPSEAVYPVETLGPLWNSVSSPLAFGKWQIANAKAGIREVVELWQDWSDTPTGQALKRSDTEDLLGTMMLNAEGINKASESGAFQVTAGDSLQIVTHEQGFAPAASLTESPIVNFFPRDAELITANSRDLLADHFSNQLSDFENRMAKTQLKSDLKGRRAVAALAQEVSDFYYRHLASFRRVIFDDARNVFAPPVATLAGSRGKLDAFLLRYTDNDFRENELTISNAPVPQYAAIGRLANPSQPVRLFNDASRAVLSGFNVTAPEAIIGPSDLGLGVDTYAFQDDVLLGSAHNVSIKTAGDFKPHYFVIDGWLVVSTSIQLSKSILAAWRDPTQRFVVPAAGNSRLTGFGLLPANTLARIVEQSLNLFSDLSNNNGTVNWQGPISEGLGKSQHFTREFAATFGECFNLVDRIAWTTVDGSVVRVTRFDMSFAKVPRRE